MDLWRLDNDILWGVLGLWLNVEDLCKFDLAIVRSKDRDEIDAVLASNQFSHSGCSHSHGHMYDWIIKHGVSMKSLEIRNKIVSWTQAECLLNTSKSLLEEVSLHPTAFSTHDTYPSEELAVLLNDCKRLRTLHFKPLRLDSTEWLGSFFSVFASESLRHINLVHSYFGTKCSVDALYQIGFTCPNLESLEAFHTAEAGESSKQVMVRGPIFRRLKRLKIGGTKWLLSTILQYATGLQSLQTHVSCCEALVKYQPPLVQLDVPIMDEVEAAHWKQFVESCPTLSEVTLVGLADESCLQTICRIGGQLKSFSVDGRRVIQRFSMHALATVFPFLSGLHSLRLDSLLNCERVVEAAAQSCRELREFSLDTMFGIHQAVLVTLVRSNVNLIRVKLTSSAIGEDVLLALANCVSLEELVLPYCEKVPEEGMMAVLRECPQLTRLDIGYALVSEVVIAHVISPSRVQVLSVSLAYLPPAVISSLANKNSHLRDITFRLPPESEGTDDEDPRYVAARGVQRALGGGGRSVRIA